MNPAYLNQWFPLEQQCYYVSKLTGRLGLTRRRAEYFVRLWAYLLLKQQQELGKRLVQPLTELSPLQGAIPCTHREAAELFYSEKERGSDRAAGMMLDQFAALGLIKKKFDGNTICIQIRPLPDLTELPQQQKPLEVQCDAFNPRNDAVPAANLLLRNYSWLAVDAASAQKIARSLRDWGQKYGTSMRVLRRCDNHNPIGFYMLYPTASQSEGNFFLPPSNSIYLGSNKQTDPMQMAVPGDGDCMCAFIRGLTIDAPYMQLDYICQLVEDVQQTLVRMQQDFPNLCDLYAIMMNPFHETLGRALGFQVTVEDNDLSLYWVYQSVDRFLAVNVPQALAHLKLEPSLQEA